MSFFCPYFLSSLEISENLNGTSLRYSLTGLSALPYICTLLFPLTHLTIVATCFELIGLSPEKLRRLGVPLGNMSLNRMYPPSAITETPDIQDSTYSMCTLSSALMRWQTYLIDCFLSSRHH